MEAKLGRLAGGGNDKAEKGEGEVHVFRSCKHLLHLSGVEVYCYSGHGKNEADISDSVVKNSL